MICSSIVPRPGLNRGRPSLVGGLRVSGAISRVFDRMLKGSVHMGRQLASGCRVHELAQIYLSVFVCVHMSVCPCSAVLICLIG